MSYTQTWNSAFKTSPANSDLVSQGAGKIRDLKVALEERFLVEHLFDVASNATQLEHRAGSAKAFFLATASAPTTRPGGTALDATDNGRLWFDTTLTDLKVWSTSSWVALSPTLAKNSTLLAGVTPGAMGLELLALAGSLGTGWSTFLDAAISTSWPLATALGSNWSTAFASTLGTNWSTALGATLGTGWSTALAATCSVVAWNAGSGNYVLPGFGGNGGIYTGPTPSWQYVKVSEFKCAGAGTVSIKFSLYRSVGAGTATARFYINGEPAGIERTATETPTIYAEDFTVVLGDLVQIYINNGIGFPDEGYTIVSGFSLCTAGYGQLYSV